MTRQGHDTKQTDTTAKKPSRLWIPIVLALLGWILAYLSPLYHDWTRQPKITAQYQDVDFIHFMATRIEITNSGKREARNVQCLLPRFVFPGGGTPCTTAIKEITPYDVRYVMDNLSNKRIITILDLPPQVTFGFNIYKDEIKSVQDYYRLDPSISYDTVLEGVQVKTSKGDVPLTKKVETKKDMTEKPRRKAPGKHSN